MMVWKAGPLPKGTGKPLPLGGANCLLIPKFRNVTEQVNQFTRGYGIWGGMQRKWSRSYTENSWFLHSILEVLPRAQNKVEIDPTKVDAWGVNVPSIQMNYSDNELKMRDDALTSMGEMCQAANLFVSSQGSSVPGLYVHELGGARMGHEASSSVLNRFNQCWDARNLFVVDGSCFVTSGWQNPSLTMMALAVRASAYIVQEFRVGNL
jgi:hypothetical protein